VAVIQMIAAAIRINVWLLVMGGQATLIAKECSLKSGQSRPQWRRRRRASSPAHGNLNPCCASSPKLMQHLPKDRREMSTRRHVAAEFDKAAAGADVADVAIALHMVLMFEARTHCCYARPDRNIG
jgi:hypothetical protein